MEIRGFTVKCAKTKAKRRKNKELTLQNKINELQLSLERNPNNNHAQNELLAAKLLLQKNHAQLSTLLSFIFVRVLNFSIFGDFKKFMKLKSYEKNRCCKN